MILSYFLAAASFQGSAYLPIPDSNEVGFCVILRSGSGEDPDGKSGVTHLVEHLLFRKGAPGSLDYDIEALGGRLEATTYRDFIRLWVTVPSLHALQAVPVLKRLLAGENWSTDVINQEKAMVLQELRLRNLVPAITIRERLWQAVFQSDPFGRPSGGVADEVALLSAEDVHARIKQIRDTAAVTAVAVGGEIDGLADALRELVITPGEAHSRQRRSLSAGVQELEHDVYRAIGIALPPDEGADTYVAAQVALEVLAGSGDSLAAARGIVLEPVWEPAGSACLVGVIFRATDAKQVSSLLRDAAAVGDSAVKRAMQRVASRWKRTLEDVEARAFWEAFARAWAFGDSHTWERASEQVNPEQVRQILSKFVRTP